MRHILSFRQLFKCMFLVVALSVASVLLTTKTLITFREYGCVWRRRWIHLNCLTLFASCFVYVVCELYYWSWKIRNKAYDKRKEILSEQNEIEMYTVIWCFSNISSFNVFHYIVDSAATTGLNLATIFWLCRIPLISSIFPKNIIQWILYSLWHISAWSWLNKVQGF